MDEEQPCVIFEIQMPLEQLTRARIIEALNLLGELAERQDVTLELCIYGGTAMMLAYGARESTKDVDVTAKPSDIALGLAKQVGEELGLADGWLNDDVRRFLSDQGTFAPFEIQGLEAAAKRRLKITRPSAAYLLAMKCLAGRSAMPGYPGDVGDIRFLIEKMGLHSADQVEQQLERFYPRDALTPKARELIEGIISQQKGK